MVIKNENQISRAKQLADKNNMNIEFIAKPAEELSFSEETFDVVTACQCFWYFDHKKLMPKIYNFLRKNGKLLILYMAWLHYLKMSL